MKLFICLLEVVGITACAFFYISNAWALSPGCLEPQTPTVSEQLVSPELKATSLYWATAAAHRLQALKQRRLQAIHAKMTATGIVKGQTVVTVVEFCVDRRGAVVAKELTKSSGFLELDTEAMTMVAKSSPFRPIPAELPVQFLSAAVPIVFRF
jgi:TonB family protein